MDREYLALKRGEKLLNGLTEARPLFEKLAEQYPDRYKDKAAVICYTLGAV